MSRETNQSQVSAATAVGLLVSVIWIVLVVLYFSFSGQNLREAFGTPMIGLLTLLAIVLPIALIWTAALTAGTASKLKSEANALRSEMHDVSQSLKDTTERLPQEQQNITKQLKLIAEMTLSNDKHLKKLSNDMQPTQVLDVLEMDKNVFGSFQTAEDETQINLPLTGNSEVELPPMPVSDLIAALNFPNDTKDKEGFRALRRAMEDRKLRNLLESAQSVLSGLTEDGIYMDDLQPDRPVTSAWRKFAQGARGKEVTTVGGVRDKAVLTIAKSRMKTKDGFRGEVHHFLRQFDSMIEEFEPRLQNHELTDLADTRTTRCFMIMARISGAFD